LKKQTASSLMIICATLIWGAGYAAQSAGMDFVSPLTFNAVRFFIGGTMALLPSLFFLIKRPEQALPAGGKSVIIAGIICGAVLCLAINLQQFGLNYTTVANASFITSLYVILVPLASLILFKKRPPYTVWTAVIAAAFGVYLLSMSGEFRVNLGDLLVFFCAVTFTAQILLISYFSPKHNVFILACVQFYTVFVLSLILAIVFETPNITAIQNAAPYLLYTGVLSSGIAYILQMKAQKTTEPTIAAVLFSFESVVAAITAWVILNQVLSPRELIGCTLIFAAILTAQVNHPAAEKEKKCET